MNIQNSFEADNYISESTQTDGTGFEDKSCQTSYSYLVQKQPNTSTPMVIKETSKIDVVSSSSVTMSTDRSSSEFSVMADRGFKGIETVLIQKGSKLFRPPSATKDQKMTKGEVKMTKQIASLRIHVERSINRIRDFKMCKPHVTLDTNLVKYIDEVVKIACGLSNIQQQLIKTN